MVNDSPSINTVTVDVDFKEWATKKDLDQTKTHSPAKQIGKMRMPKIRKGKGKPLFTPQAVNGLVIEDSNGTPLILHVTRVLKPEVQVSSPHQILILHVHFLT